MQDYNNLSIGFRDFIDQQSTTDIVDTCIDLSRKNPHFFKLSNGVLSIANSSVKWPSFIQRGFNSQSIQQAVIYTGLPEYEVFMRLLSYNAPIYCTTQPMVDVFKNADSLVSRDLYNLELELFHINSLSNELPKFVKSFDEFVNNLNKLFLFYWYVY